MNYTMLSCGTSAEAKFGVAKESSTTLRTSYATAQARHRHVHAMAKQSSQYSSRQDSKKEEVLLNRRGLCGRAIAVVLGTAIGASQVQVSRIKPSGMFENRVANNIQQPLAVQSVHASTMVCNFFGYAEQGNKLCMACRA